MARSKKLTWHYEDAELAQWHSRVLQVLQGWGRYCRSIFKGQKFVSSGRRGCQHHAYARRLKTGQDPAIDISRTLACDAGTHQVVGVREGHTSFQRLSASSRRAAWLGSLYSTEEYLTAYP